MSQLRTGTMSSYMKDLSKIKPLTSAEKLNLYLDITFNQSERAKKRLIEGSLAYAMSLAKWYFHCGIPMEDLVQAANIGLMKAANKFIPAKGFEFITYARLWIMREIQLYIDCNITTVRLPANKIKKLQETTGYKDYPASPDEPWQDVVMEGSGESACRIQMISMDNEFYANAGAKEGKLLHEMIADEHAHDGEKWLRQLEAEELLERAFSRLTERERRAISLYFNSGPDRDIDELCQILDDKPITRQRFHQIKDAAMQKCKAVPSTQKAVRQFFQEA